LDFTRSVGSETLLRQLSCSSTGIPDGADLSPLVSSMITAELRDVLIFEERNSG